MVLVLPDYLLEEFAFVLGLLRVMFRLYGIVLLRL